MKILFIANGIVGAKPGVSGGETRFLEIAKKWQKMGHQIHLLAPAGAQKLLNEFGLKAKLHPVTRLKSTGRWVFVYLFARHLVSFPRGLEKLNFDIVYSTSEQIYDVLPAYKIKQRNPSTKWAVVVHWLPPWPIWQRSGSKFWNSLLFFIAERLGLGLARRRADILLPVSIATTKQLQTIRVPAWHFQTVECGVNYLDIQKIVRKKTPKIYDGVFMKRIQASKGIFDLIDCWQKIVARRPKAKLLVIGSGVDEASAKKMVKELGLGANIIFTGAITETEKKITLLSQGKIFILPSYEENWAISIGEAMAAGLPVVCYQLKELDEVWQEAIITCPLGKKEALTSQVLSLLENPVKRQKMSQKCQDYVLKYAWKTIAPQELEYILKAEGQRERD